MEIINTIKSTTNLKKTQCHLTRTKINLLGLVVASALIEMSAPTSAQAGVYEYTGDNFQNPPKIFEPLVTSKHWFGPLDSDSENENTVDIKADDNELSAFGGYSTNNVHEDTLTVENGLNIHMGVGGYSTSGNANKNSVVVLGSGNTFYGGWGNQEASRNTLTIEGEATLAVGGRASAGSANNNTVVLRGSNTHATYLYVAVLDGFAEKQKDREASGNQLIIDGNATIDTAFVGFQSISKTPQDKGNSVSIAGTLLVGSIEGFDQMNVFLKPENHQTAALTIKTNDVDYRENGLSLANKTLTITLGAGVNPLGRYYVIDRQKDAKSVELNNSVIEVKDEFTIKKWIYEDGGEQLILENGEINQRQPNETRPTGNTKTLTDSDLGTVAWINQGAEFVADEGLNAIAELAEPGKLATFGAIKGGYSQYQTGSDVDLTGASLATGLASRYQDLSYAGFIESGWASSNSHIVNTKVDAAHNYYGVGAAGRWQINDGLHLDGSLRTGWANTKFTGDYGLQSLTYTSNAFYFTGHVGIGYVAPLTKTLSVEPYARYVYSYLGSDTAKVSYYNFHMDSVDTQAVRLGVRLLGNHSPTLSWRAGVALEHVYGGTAKSSLTGFSNTSLDTPSLSGNTGIMELGSTLKTSADSPWSFDFGVKGYVGNRRGITGNGTLLYRF